MREIDWSFTDKIVFINLEKREDRRLQIEACLKRFGAPEANILRFGAIEDARGAIGCARSHIEVLKMAQAEKWKNVLILEDDFLFNEDDESIERMNYFTLNLRRYSWDVAMLSASYYIIKNIERHFYKVEWAYLAHSYLVNSHYYGELIDNFSEAISIMQSHYAGETSEFQSIDTNWLKLMKKDNWVGVYPSVGIQKPSFSDIENTFMDREAFFHRTLDEIKQYGSY